MLLVVGGSGVHLTDQAHMLLESFLNYGVRSQGSIFSDNHH